MKFDGSLESAVAAVDAVLEDNPRASGKQVREAVAGLKVDIPTVEAQELVVADGVLEFDGVKYVEADQLDEVRKQLDAAEASLVELRKADGGPSVSALPGSQVLLEAADLLDERPNVSTTNHRVARWLRSL